VEITPLRFPIAVSGGFLSGFAERASAPLYARALALDDGRRRVVIAVVDTLMMSREFLDAVKENASRTTGVPPDRMLISATHTHSAPPLMGCLGTDPDANYIRLVQARLQDAIERSVRNLEPARIGWTVVQDYEHTHCRQWILRPDRILQDPFGEWTVRANMHPGYQNPNFIGPTGPVDPDLTVVALQTADGAPIALLANYSMHYVGGGEGVSPDYYGPFADSVKRRIASAPGKQPFVAMMSQGTSGDLHWMDYSQPRKLMNLSLYAEAISQQVCEAWKKIQFRSAAPISMAETKLTLRRRVPGPERLAWARQIYARMGNALPKNQQEVYAREQILLAENPVRELKLQALQIGELGIAAIPNEVFALSALEIKAQSSARPLFLIELANGAEGYIPPPELHPLGGYTTWPARTASLEVGAEPKIVDAVTALIEQVSGKRRRGTLHPNGLYAQRVLSLKPYAYWRGNEFRGPVARDASGRRRDGRYQGGVVFYLDGPASSAFSAGEINRCPHFAGGRISAETGSLGLPYSVEMWIYNGLPADARPVTGYLFERGPDRLSIGGTKHAAGRLRFEHSGGALEGTATVPLKTWLHLVLVRERESVRIYLNGNAVPDVAGGISLVSAPANRISIGGSEDDSANFEGRIDEISVFNRALNAAEISRNCLSAVAPAGRSWPSSFSGSSPGAASKKGRR